jgi:hypothetical protein
MAINKTKVKAIGMLIAQVAPGVEVEALVDSDTGIMYLPTMESVAIKGGAKAAPAEAATVSDPKPAGRGRGAAAPAAEAAPSAGRGRGAAPAAAAPVGVDGKAVAAAFDGLDKNTMSEADAVAALVSLVPKAAKPIVDAITKHVAGFCASPDMLPATAAKAAEAILNGGGAAPAAGRGRGAAAAAPVVEEEVEAGELTIDDLKKDDYVNVYCVAEDEDGNDISDWYPATVVVKRGGKIEFKFDDGDEQPYDADAHTGFEAIAE